MFRNRRGPQVWREAKVNMPSSSQDPTDSDIAVAKANSDAWREILDQLEDATAALAASGTVHDEDTRTRLLERSDAVAGLARLIRNGRALPTPGQLEHLQGLSDLGGRILSRFQDERASVLAGLAQVGRDTQTLRFFERPDAVRKREWSG
jgi:hypothetical protein